MSAWYAVCGMQYAEGTWYVVLGMWYAVRGSYVVCGMRDVVRGMRYACHIKGRAVGVQSNRNLQNELQCADAIVSDTRRATRQHPKARPGDCTLLLPLHLNQDAIQPQLHHTLNAYDVHKTYRRASRNFDHVGVGREARIRDDHFIPRLNQRHCREEEARLAPGSHDNHI